MHKCYDDIASHISIPILHIAELTVDALLEKNISKVALLGTRYTMEDDFYKDRLIKRGLEVHIPNAEDRVFVHNVIYKELCHGIIREESRVRYLQIIEKLRDGGAEGVILGCTEIGLLVAQSDTDVPLFDTTAIHAERAALYSIR
jgi:aspartate racemase